MDPRGRSGDRSSKPREPVGPAERPADERADEAPELPPPPPWGEVALSELVSEALVVRAPVRGVRVIEELEIDLDFELDEEPPEGLRERLFAHFGGVHREVERALAIYRGCYRTLADYAAEALEDGGIPEWLWPYIDLEAIARDWWNGGALWVLEEPGDDGAASLHVFAG